MGRYLKYLEIVNKIDSALEKMTSGNVDINKDLPRLKTMLETQQLALCMSQKIDHIDDAVKSTAKLYAMGDESAQEVVKSLMHILKSGGQGQGGHSGGMGQGMGQQGINPGMGQSMGQGGQPKGNDFRGGREDSGFESWSASGHPTGVRQAPRGTHEMNPSHREHAEYGEYYPEQEEDRQGVPGTGRYGRRRGYYRRSRSEADEMRNDYRTARSEHDDHDEEMEREENRRGRSRRTGRYVHRADGGYEGEDEKNFMFPNLGIPGFYGVPSFWNNMNNRMGFGANPHEANQPYNGVQLPVQNMAYPMPQHGAGHAMNGIQLPVQNNVHGTQTSNAGGNPSHNIQSANPSGAAQTANPAGK